MRVINPDMLRSFFGLTLMLAVSFGCGPPSSQGDGQARPESETGGVPEITDEIIYERINGAWVTAVPPESGSAEPIIWRFHESEPKEISVVEKQVDGKRATIVLDIKTSSSPRARLNRHLAGQIRTEWELKTGWVLRKWEIVNAENISMKYRDLPKPSPEDQQSSNNAAPSGL